MNSQFWLEFMEALDFYDCSGFYMELWTAIIAKMNDVIDEDQFVQVFGLPKERVHNNKRLHVLDQPITNFYKPINS